VQGVAIRIAATTCGWICPSCTRPTRGRPYNPLTAIRMNDEKRSPGPPPATTRRDRQVIRLVAAFEAFKGLIVVLTATGVLALIHHDLHALAARLVEHAHLDPAARYPRIFVDAATRLQDMRLWALALGAAAYAALRFVEAYGLYFERAWAEWLAAVSGAIYVPLECARLLRHHTWLSAGVLLLNIIVVVVMVRALMERRAATR